MIDYKALIFSTPGEWDEQKCLAKPHDWKILITIEESSQEVAICKNCSKLSGGFIRIEND